MRRSQMRPAAARILQRLSMSAFRRRFAPPAVLFLLGGWIIGASSCLPSPHYQDQRTVSPSGWQSKEGKTFSFDVSDTAARYHTYFIIRHTEAYPNSNIWLHIDSRGPGDSAPARTRVEVPLTTPAGQWLGRGTGAIYEHRMPLSRNDNPVRFPRPGRYTVRISHAMRTDPLPEVLQVGLRVEKK